MHHLAVNIAGGRALIALARLVILSAVRHTSPDPLLVTFDSFMSLPFRFELAPSARSQYLIQNPKTTRKRQENLCMLLFDGSVLYFLAPSTCALWTFLRYVLISSSLIRVLTLYFLRYSGTTVRHPSGQDDRWLRTHRPRSVRPHHLRLLDMP